MLQGLWTRHEPATSKSSSKAFYFRALQRPTAAFHRTSTVPLTLETVDFRDHDSSRTRAGNRKVEKSKWRWCCFSPRSGVMQMREALRFVPVSNFRGIYANVEQNGWSELVIHESSEVNDSLDTATHTRLLPAFWMTSCLFISLDFLPHFTFLLPFSLLNFFLFFRVHFLLIPHPPFKFHSAFNHISSFPCSPFLSPFTVSSLFLFLFSPFIAITSPYIPLLFDFLINFQ